MISLPWWALTALVNALVVLTFVIHMAIDIAVGWDAGKITQADLDWVFRGDTRADSRVKAPRPGSDGVVWLLVALTLLLCLLFGGALVVVVLLRAKRAVRRHT